MIEYNNATNEIILEPKRIPQTSGKITETIKVGGYSQEKSYFLELKCPKNKRYVTGKIDFSSGDGLIELPEAIINNVGDVYVQLVIRNTDGEVVGKSFVSDEPLYVIEQSINAVDDVADERVGDCLSSALKATENMVSFQKSLEEKLASGKLNGKDGTKVIVGGAEKGSVAFTKDPQEQLDEKVSNSQFEVEKQDKTEKIREINSKIEQKQDKLTQTQLKNISDVKNKLSAKWFFNSGKELKYELLPMETFELIYVGTGYGVIKILYDNVEKFASEGFTSFILGKEWKSIGISVINNTSTHSSKLSEECSKISVVITGTHGSYIEIKQ